MSNIIPQKDRFINDKPVEKIRVTGQVWRLEEVFQKEVPVITTIRESIQDVIDDKHRELDRGQVGRKMSEKEVRFWKWEVIK